MLYLPPLLPHNQHQKTHANHKNNPNQPKLKTKLTTNFYHTNPKITHHFTHITFLSDNRADLPKLRRPSLILQCTEDAIAPRAVGEYLHRNLANSQLVQLQATGHCPNLSAPQETAAAIRAFLRVQTQV
jgi:sigma-B regulation protein RsbQ